MSWKGSYWISVSGEKQSNWLSVCDEETKKVINQRFQILGRSYQIKKDSVSAAGKPSHSQIPRVILVVKLLQLPAGLLSRRITFHSFVIELIETFRKISKNVFLLNITRDGVSP